MLVYRVRHPIVVGRGTAQGRIITQTLPIGALIKLPYRTPLIGLIGGRWEGQLVYIFAHDLIANADPILLEVR